MRKRLMFSPFHFEVFCILVCAGLVHASVCTPKKGISISPLNFSQNGHSVQKPKNGLSPFHLVVFSQFCAGSVPTVLARKKLRPSHFTTLCFARTVSLFLLGYLIPLCHHFLLICSYNRALSFQLGDVSTESSIPFGKFWQPSIGGETNMPFCLTTVQLDIGLKL